MIVVYNTGLPFNLIIFPALTSMRIFKQFRAVIISSAILSVFCFVAGLILSYVYATPTGASVAILNIGCFMLFSVFGWLRGKRCKE